MGLMAFQNVRNRAETRKGGAATLESLLPHATAGWADQSDDRFLSMMAKCIFRAGFVWRVVNDKWPDFETAFEGFDPRGLRMQPDEFWQALASDARIVRNATKIKAVRDNALFVVDVADEHGSFGKFLADWPAGDQIGLLANLAKRGSRLGGATAQYFLRMTGRDAFILSSDVVACLRDSGIDISATPKSKSDLAKIQAAFNTWHQETGLSYVHLSRIASMSVGENYSAETLAENTG